MSIDLSGALKAAFEKEKKAYERALKKGDNTKASRHARKCAQILRTLAEKSPYAKKEYLAKAEKWEKVARDIEAGRFRAERREPAEKGGIEEDYSSTIASLISTSRVTWQDIGGLEDVKKLMMETIVVAGLQAPEAVKPWKGILLFGPPGTGKTLLASAAAGSLKATFFNVKASRMLSKYFGESSKLISALYEEARKRAPSIVFIDEFDALSLSRSGEQSEASRRMLSTLLAELDGFQDKKSKLLLLTLAATNTPWDLDQAVLSRFPRRIYVPLPDKPAVKEIIRIHTKGVDISGVDLEELASRCVERLYSGRDLANLCQQAIWHMIREENPNLHELASLPYEELKKRKLKVRGLRMQDFEEAMAKIKSPLKKSDIERYEKWNEEFGG